VLSSVYQKLNVCSVNLSLTFYRQTKHSTSKVLQPQNKLNHNDYNIWVHVIFISITSCCTKTTLKLFDRFISANFIVGSSLGTFCRKCSSKYWFCCMCLIECNRAALAEKISWMYVVRKIVTEFNQIYLYFLVDNWTKFVFDCIVHNLFKSQTR
jgi:hypothetical protein